MTTRKTRICRNRTLPQFKGEDIAGHVTLTKGERSEVAELAARLL